MSAGAPILCRSDAGFGSISIGPSDDTDTGIAFDGSVIRFFVNAVQKFLISSTTVRFGTVFEVTQASASLPSLTFISDTDTGIFRRNANEVAFSTGGTESGFFDAGQSFHVTNNVFADSFYVSDRAQ